MNKIQRVILKQVATGAMLLALLTLQLVPLPVHAVDTQVMPIDTMARSGFTHVFNVTIGDVTNALTHNQWRVYPRSGTFSIGDVIDKLGLYIESPFFVTNANAGSNAVFLNVGITGATNNALSQFPISSNHTLRAFITNLVAPIVISAATNALFSSITFSNADMSAQVPSGELHLFIRVTPFDRLKSQ